MGNKFPRAVSTLLILFIAFPQSLGQIQPVTSKVMSEVASSSSVNSHIAVVSSSKECNPDKVKDPKAPCSDEMFSEVSLTKNTQLTYVCGVNVKNAFGTIVAKLWENVTVTWQTSGYSINGATRSTWVTNSTYGWTNLSGPVPSSGYYGGSYNMVLVITRGTVTYFGGPWKSYQVRLTLWGNESNPNWSCTIY